MAGHKAFESSCVEHPRRTGPVAELTTGRRKHRPTTARRATAGTVCPDRVSRSGSALGLGRGSCRSRARPASSPGERARREGQHWVVEGALDLASLESELGFDLSCLGVSTVAGPVLSEARRMPRVGEAVVIDRHRFGVSQQRDRP